MEKLTFVGEFKTGDVALGVLLSSALRPEQEHPTQQPDAAPERAHGPGVEFGDVLQIDASRVDVLSLVRCRRGGKKAILVAVTLLVFRRFRYEASGQVQARSQQMLINTEFKEKKKKKNPSFQGSKIKFQLQKSSDLQGRLEDHGSMSQQVGASHTCDSKLSLTKPELENKDNCRGRSADGDRR